MYKMKTQLRKGEKSERHLDSVFSKWYKIKPASRAEQRLGIDRHFKNGDNHHTVEYKTDWRAAQTGNAFVETISVDTQNKPGWAYSSQSDILVYYVPGDDLIYIFEFPEFRKHLPRWIETFRKAPPIPNDGYNTIGILVPLAEFEEHAKIVLSI